MCLQSEKVLSEYLEEKDQSGKNILLADQFLTEAEQKKEGIRTHIQSCEKSGHPSNYLIIY